MCKKKYNKIYLNYLKQVFLSFLQAFAFLVNIWTMCFADNRGCLSKLTYLNSRT